MITFYMVRHGETFFNKVFRLQGFCDSPLTEKGIQDAYDAEKALEHVHFTKVYSSTSERARDTAEIIKGDRDIELEALKDLREFDYGEMDGELIKDVLEEIKKRAVTDSFKDVGGDDTESLWERTQRAFNHILLNSNEGDVILVVSHGSFIRHMFKPMFGIDPETIRKSPKGKGNLVPNGGITKFIYDGEWKLISLPTPPDEYQEVK